MHPFKIQIAAPWRGGEGGLGVFNPYSQGASQKKNTGFFGSFSQMSDPPLTPYVIL